MITFPEFAGEDYSSTVLPTLRALRRAVVYGQSAEGWIVVILDYLHNVWSCEVGGLLSTSMPLSLWKGQWSRVGGECEQDDPTPRSSCCLRGRLHHALSTSSPSWHRGLPSFDLVLLLIYAADEFAPWRIPSHHSYEPSNDLKDGITRGIRRTGHPLFFARTWHVRPIQNSVKRLRDTRLIDHIVGSLARQEWRQRSPDMAEQVSRGYHRLASSAGKQPWPAECYTLPVLAARSIAFGPRSFIGEHYATLVWGTMMGRSAAVRS